MRNIVKSEDNIYENDTMESNIIEGRNAVIEAFRSGKTVDKVLILEGCQDGTINTIVREAKKHNVLIKYVKKNKSAVPHSFKIAKNPTHP